MLTRRAFSSLGIGAGLMGLFGLAGCTKGTAFEGRQIRRVSYASGGGMTGGGESSELCRQNDGTVTLCTRFREWHNSRETGMDYVMDEAAFERFAQIANDYDLLAESKRELSPFQPLDAPTSSISFDVLDEEGDYDPDASFRVSDTQDLTDKGWEGFKAVVAALEELASQGEGVSYVEPVKLTFVLDGYQLEFALNDSPAAQALAARCPFDIEIENYADNEKIFYLDEPLDVSDTPLATGTAGTLCYFAPWNDVVLFYGDGASYEGLYELGAVQDDWDIAFIADIEPGPASVYSSE